MFKQTSWYGLLSIFFMLLFVVSIFASLPAYLICCSSKNIHVRVTMHYPFMFCLCIVYGLLTVETWAHIQKTGFYRVNPPKNPLKTTHPKLNPILVSCSTNEIFCYG